MPKRRPRTITTIDLTPDAKGYMAIGAMLVAQLHDDFTESRRAEAFAILRGVVDIAFSLGAASTQSRACRLEAEALRDKLFSRINGG